MASKARCAVSVIRGQISGPPSSSSKPCERCYLCGDFALWLFSVLLTGILIGLGGPFWYDAVRGLARAVQVVRGRGELETAPIAATADRVSASAAFKRNLDPLRTSADAAPVPMAGVPLMRAAAAALESLVLTVGATEFAVVDAIYDDVRNLLQLDVAGVDGAELGLADHEALRLAATQLIARQFPGSTVDTSRIRLR